MLPSCQFLAFAFFLFFFQLALLFFLCLAKCCFALKFDLPLSILFFETFLTSLFKRSFLFCFPVLYLQALPLVLGGNLSFFFLCRDSRLPLLLELKFFLSFFFFETLTRKFFRTLLLFKSSSRCLCLANIVKFNCIFAFNSGFLLLFYLASLPLLLNLGRTRICIL